MKNYHENMSWAEVCEHIDCYGNNLPDDIIEKSWISYMKIKYPEIYHEIELCGFTFKLKK